MFKKEYYFSKIAEISSKKTTNNVLYLLSFAESIVFPIPVDPLLAACIIAKPKKVFYITIFTVLASVVGGIFGWIVGLYLGLGIQNLVEYIPGLTLNDLQRVNAAFKEWGLLLTFIGAFTPLPYKLIAISSGATGVPILVFIAGSVFGRGIRFGIVASLSYFFGEKAINFITNNLALTTVFLGVFFTILWFLII